jgi:hypothetical protein
MSSMSKVIGELLRQQQQQRERPAQEVELVRRDSFWHAFDLLERVPLG